MHDKLVDGKGGNVLDVTKSNETPWELATGKGVPDVLVFDAAGPAMKRFALSVLNHETGPALTNRLVERLLRSGPVG